MQEARQYSSLIVTEDEIDIDIARMAAQSGVSPQQFLAGLAGAGIKEKSLRAQNSRGYYVASAGAGAVSFARTGE